MLIRGCAQVLQGTRTVLSSRTIQLTALIAGSVYTCHPLLMMAAAVYALWCNQRIGEELNAISQRIMHEIVVGSIQMWYPLPEEADYRLVSDTGSGLGLYQKINPAHTTYFDYICRLSNGAILYLGALPHEEQAKELKVLNCRLIVSLVEDHEYDVFCGHVVHTSEWLEVWGMDWAQYPVGDHKALSPDILNAATGVIIAALNQGTSVYVHCRAGKGRSACVVTSVLKKLLASEEIAWNEALAKVQAARPQVHLSQTQFDALTNPSPQVLG